MSEGFSQPSQTHPEDEPLPRLHSARRSGSPHERSFRRHQVSAATGLRDLPPYSSAMAAVAKGYRQTWSNESFGAGEYLLGVTVCIAKSSQVGWRQILQVSTLPACSSSVAVAVTHIVFDRSRAVSCRTRILGRFFECENFPDDR